jgi:CheY-like chemotaxis protein
MRRQALRIAALCAAGLVLACGDSSEQRGAAAPRSPNASGAAAGGAPQGGVASESEVVDDARLRGADADVGEWLTTGRTYSEQRYSPLDQINSDNVGRMHEVWSFETGLGRGHEATPIVHDGVLFFTGSWSVVFAVDARTGKQLWKYDPQVEKIVAASDFGRDAIEKAPSLRPDLIVIDISMPVMNGLEAAPLLIAILPNVLIILLTTHDFPQLLQIARAAGIHAVVPKTKASTHLIPQAEALISGRSQTA